ncbi:MAG: hypothetical protein FJY56_03235 [Betaproteobacteria bacterium]|nr:hypothetical protein [Betaproteobacteria bacterium]
MFDIQRYPYMCFVRFDLVNKEFDRLFNQYYDDHIQELADKPGYSTAWRTRELRGGPVVMNAGPLEQEYQQIYAIADPALFKSFPSHPPPPVPEHEPWRRDVGNWGRVFYRVHDGVEKDPRAGRYWARCESRRVAAAHSEWQTAGARHLRQVLENLPGVHRAWLMQHAPHPAQIGADPAGDVLMLYELDAPENLFDPSLNQERMPFNAGANTFAARHFAHLLRKAEPRR